MLLFLPFTVLLRNFSLASYEVFLYQPSVPQLQPTLRGAFSPTPAGRSARGDSLEGAAASSGQSLCAARRGRRQTWRGKGGDLKAEEAFSRNKCHANVVP